MTRSSSNADMPKDLFALSELIRTEIGVDFSSAADQLSRKIRGRLAATQCTTVDEYMTFLQDAPGRRRELIELANDVTNNETYFFREQTQLAHVCGHVVTSMLHAKPRGEVLRILSVPCSSGEEPYSIAMNLMDQHQPLGTRIAVYGADVSERSLAAARDGRYRQVSFRGVAPAFIERYFQPHHSGYTLSHIVKQKVQFFPANLIDADSLRFAAPYDIVFCRNVMIYFDRETQVRVLDTMAHVLRPGGYLCFGHADTAPGLQRNFETVTAAGVTLYRRRATG